MAHYPLDRAYWPSEYGSLGIPFTFLDDGEEEDSAVTPTTAAWRLTDGEGNVINDRSAVTITPAESVQIALKGADLSYEQENGALRQVIIYGTYDSATLGSDTSFVHVVTFQVVPIKGWPAS
jgi:hypothetical protein